MTSKINIGIISDYGDDHFNTNALIFNFKSVHENIEVYQLVNRVKSSSIQYIAYLLNISLQQFPKNSVFFVAYDCNPDKFKNVLIIELDNQLIVTFNPKIVHYLNSNATISVYEIPINQFKFKPTFSELEIFKYIFEIIQYSETLVSKFEPVNIDSLFTNEVIQSGSAILLKGNVIYIDSNENLVVNITRKTFDKFVSVSKEFSIQFGRKNKISKISENYGDKIGGDLIAVFNNWDYLEIAINEGKASTLLGMDINSSLLIEFI